MIETLPVKERNGEVFVLTRFDTYQSSKTTEESERK